jgi:hypothetical protein
VALFPDDAVEELLRVYGEEELELARTLIGSRTLREAARLIVDAQAGPDGQVARIVIPHYWAVYYHDGRPGFSAPAGRFLVFFRDPEDDPRLAGGYPVGPEDVRHLTRAEFERGLEENARAALEGSEPFMFVLRSVGPAGAHPFFDELARGAAERMDFLAEAAIDAYIQDNIDEEGPEKRTARVRL